jgi:hypothetical protein
MSTSRFAMLFAPIALLAVACGSEPPREPPAPSEKIETTGSIAPQNLAECVCVRATSTCFVDCFAVTAEYACCNRCCGTN